MPGRLEDKVGIITGGAGFIGSAITQSFCREGARVVIAGFDESKWQKFQGKLSAAEKDEVAFVKADVSDHAQIRKMAKQVVEKQRRIDILVALGRFQGRVDSQNDG